MFNLKNISLMVIVIIIITACSFSGSDNTKTKEYKIGAILPLSGAGATLGQPMANGLKMAVEEINNQGGMNGQQIKLILQDSKLDVKTSADTANFLGKIENVDIASVLFGLPAEAVSPIFQETRTPFLYEAYIRSPLDNPWAFKANFDALAGCEELIQYAKDNQLYNKLGVLMSNVQYNDLCLEGIKKIENDVKEYRYTFGDTDFKTLFTKANQDGVDRLITIGIDFEYIAMFKQLTELGFPIKMMCATANECIFPEVIKNSSPEILNNTLSIDYISPNIAETDFAKKFQNKYGSDLNFTDYAYGAIGYEEIQIIAKAFEKCSPGDRSCIKEGLENAQNYNSILGSQGFENHILKLKTNFYEFKNGKWAKTN